MMEATHTMKGFCLRSWQSSASAPAAVGFLWVRVRWGKAPESVAMKANCNEALIALMTVVMTTMAMVTVGNDGPGLTRTNKQTWANQLPPGTGLAPPSSV